MFNHISGRQDIIEKRFFGLLLQALQRAWWIIGLVSILIATSVFFYISIYDTRYEAIALVRGWRDIARQTFVSDRELEALINSPALLREAHLASAPAGQREDVAYLNRKVVIKVQWVPNSQLLSFTATGDNPENIQNLLTAALPILFRRFQPRELDVARLQSERQALLDTLNTLQNALQILNTLDMQLRRSEAYPVLVPARLSSLSGTVSDINTTTRRLNALNLDAFTPSEDNIVQLPTHASGPLPSRALATGILAGMATTLIGFTLIIFVSLVRTVKARDVNDRRGGV